MSKTLEVVEEAVGYRVVSPDHDSDWVVDGYSLDVEREVLVEAGALRIDATPNEEYFHIEEKYDGNHVEISISSEQQGPQEFAFPLNDDLTFEGKVEMLGVPDTAEAQDALEHLPHVELIMEYEDGEATSIGVLVDSTRYSL